MCSLQGSMIPSRPADFGGTMSDLKETAVRVGRLNRQASIARLGPCHGPAACPTLTGEGGYYAGPHPD